MVEQVDPDVDLEGYLNDAEAWLTGVVEPDFYQQGPDLERQPRFADAGVPVGQAPDGSFREYLFEGNQGAPVQEWRQYDDHSGYGADGRRDRTYARGR